MKTIILTIGLVLTAIFSGCATMPTDPQARVEAWADDATVTHDPYAGTKTLKHIDSFWGDDRYDKFWFTANLTDPNKPEIYLHLRHSELDWSFFEYAIDRQQRRFPLHHDRRVTDQALTIERMLIPVELDYLRQCAAEGKLDWRLYGSRGQREIFIADRYLLSFLEALRREGVDIGGPLTTEHATYFASAAP